MRLGVVVGKVSLSLSHPSLRGDRFVLAVPLSLAQLSETTPAKTASGEVIGEELVAIDEGGAAELSLIGMAEGAEAAFAYFPLRKPVDVYCGCQVDELNLDRSVVEELT